MSDRKPTSVVMPAVVVLVLLVAYVGAYYAMVTPAPSVGIAVAGSLVVRDERVTPDYSLPFGIRMGLRWCDSIFAPIHWLDRRIRQHVWEPTP